MPCELCGSETDSLNKVKIEGAVLKVCDSCADMGNEVKTSTTRKKKKKKSSRPRDEKVLVDDYGDRIKEEREDREMTMQELADELKEKTSVVKKIENQQLKPDKTLAKKFSRELDLELYTVPEAWDQETGSGDSRKATLGDVADIKD
ncbi:MAG: multiprotein bridging factor aMBF1 [Candidatus Nanohaloarchaea archaeon]